LQLQVFSTTVLSRISGTLVFSTIQLHHALQQVGWGLTALLAHKGHIMPVEGSYNLL